MPTYSVTAINIGSFNLGEADKVLTLFSAEKGLLRAIAKSARKPKTKIGGRAELLNVNKLLLATGRSFEIITQAESVESFPELRLDLTRLSYGLYYAELTQCLGQGLSDENRGYFQYLIAALQCQAKKIGDPQWLCLQFELGLLAMLGFQPELTYCVQCRQVITAYNLSSFNLELGGIVCQSCYDRRKTTTFQESNLEMTVQRKRVWQEETYITPLVWKSLVLASNAAVYAKEALAKDLDFSVFHVMVPAVRQNSPGHKQAINAAQKLIKSYLEHRAGKRLKSLDLIT